MDDIELVIKIPKDYYEILRKNDTIINGLRSGKTFTYVICNAVANGTPLPKGHGDLKDMSNLQYVFDLTREKPIYSGKDIERAIKSMKSIIEADTESEAT